MHYTYSVYPSGKEVKSKIKMNFYQKPIYNYRLECELDPARSMNSLINKLDKRGALTLWIDMLDSYSQLAVGILCVILITPIGTGKGTVICTPLAFITCAGMFFKPIILSFEAAD